MYAQGLIRDANATLDELRESVETLEDTARIARRVLGGTHPLTEGIVSDMECSRVVLLRARQRANAA